MRLIIIPLNEEKIKEWRAFSEEIKKKHMEKIKDMNLRYGLTKHCTWVLERDAVSEAIALYEGPGSKNFLDKLSKSKDDFDVWVKERLEKIFDIDFSEDLQVPQTELLLDSGF